MTAYVTILVELAHDARIIPVKESRRNCEKGLNTLISQSSEPEFLRFRGNWKR